MSGHSKWSKVKHQKAVTDVVKGAAFTKASRAITVAVTEGGGVTDPNHNFHLRLAIEAARTVNMPNATIERAIERGSGADAQALERVLYESFGPGGAAVLIDAATDNKFRTVAQVKQIITRHGGSVATPGAVQYLFTRKGFITVRNVGISEDEFLTHAVDAGASDISVRVDAYDAYTEPADLPSVAAKLTAMGLSVVDSGHVWKSTVSIQLDGANAKSLASLRSELEALDDVQHVYDNAA